MPTMPEVKAGAQGAAAPLRGAARLPLCRGTRIGMASWRDLLFSQLGPVCRGGRDWPRGGLRHPRRRDRAEGSREPTASAPHEVRAGGRARGIGFLPRGRALRHRSSSGRRDDKRGLFDSPLGAEPGMVPRRLGAGKPCPAAAPPLVAAGRSPLELRCEV